ncbi:MAG: hypothetical protein KDA79_07815 [Planctomycetaceae bacterium]|nr:hypothetical protein [Planctomycetaceae bacterium]
MKRWLINVGVAAYVASLCLGIGCHTLKIGTSMHCAMYFVVWDMFCGWTSYSQRTHVVGEGESGRYYELSPGPWGDIKPFGRLGRQQYDVNGLNCISFARNTLKHTDHEPITRVFIVEERWNKKFNLPDDLWHRRFDEPKEKETYFSVRHVLDGECRLARSFPSWIEHQYQRAVADNPRLAADVQNSQPFIAVTSASGAVVNPYSPASLSTRPSSAPLGSRLGN